MLSSVSFLFCAILAYIIGSVSSAILVCQAANLPDPRTQGSKNPGATNVLRIAGKPYAILVLILDALKGALPVILASLFGLKSFYIACIGLLAVVGHMYPMFFEFKGGKGVATTMGAFFALNPMMGLISLSTWLVVALYTRMSSLASLVSVTITPIVSLLAFHRIDTLIPLLLITALVIFMHQANLKRILEGTEGKINLKDHTES